MERAGLDVFAEPEPQQAATEFAGGLAGEGERQRVARIGVADGDPMGDSSRQDPGLAGPCTGHHGDEVRICGDGGTLVGIEIGDQRVGVHVGIVGRSTVRPCRIRRGC